MYASLKTLVMAGYSMGGNVTMKLAGEVGATDFPELKAFAAVSPVIELEQCVRAIERRENRIYEWNFCHNLQSRMRRKQRAFPGAFDLDGARRAITGSARAQIRREDVGVGIPPILHVAWVSNQWLDPDCNAHGVSPLRERPICTSAALGAHRSIAVRRR